MIEKNSSGLHFIDWRLRPQSEVGLDRRLNPSDLSGILSDVFTSGEKGHSPGVSRDRRKRLGHLNWWAEPYLQSSVNSLMWWARFARHWTIPTSHWQKQSRGPGRSLSHDRSTWWSHRNWIWVIPIFLSPWPQTRAFWPSSKLKGTALVRSKAQRKKQKTRESWDLVQSQVVSWWRSWKWSGSFY